MRSLLRIAALLSTGIAGTATAAGAGLCPAMASWHSDGSTQAPRWALRGGGDAQIEDSGNTVFAASLTSPAFALPAQGLALRWQQRTQLSWANSAGVLEIQLDGGVWIDFSAAGGHFLAGGYDSRAFAGNPLGARPAWGGDRIRFETRAELPAQTAATARLRFRFGSSGTGDAGPGWQIGGLACAGKAG